MVHKELVVVVVVLEKKMEQWEEHANQLGGEEEHSAEYQHHEEVPPNSSVRRSYHRPGMVEPLAGWEEDKSKRRQTSSSLRLVFHLAVACQLQHQVQDRRLKPAPTSSSSSKAEPVVFFPRDFPKKF